MNILVIGAGNMGSAFVKQLTAAGHRVAVTARDLAKARAVAAANPGATVADAGAAPAADVVVLATAYGDAATALRAAGDLAGRTVVDITNPLTADYMGLTLGHQTSAAEEIQKAFPQARVVKAFNTVFAQVLAAGPTLGGRPVPVYFAGDDAAAKASVKTLVESLGFAPVDAGGLKNARYLEPLAGLNIYFGYGAGHGTAIAPAWLRGA